MTNVSLMKILWESSLIVKLIILILLSLSIFSWAIFLKKRKEIAQIKLANQKFMNSFKSSVNLMDLFEKTKNYSFSPLAVMFQSAYSEFLKTYDAFKEKKEQHIREHYAKFGPGLLERGLKKGAAECQMKFDSMLSILASIGSLSPFIGLFGTVIGIINSFSGLSTGGTSLETVAPGIAEALIVTAIGLLTAIPAVWFYNYFNHENDKFIAQMDSFSQDFINLIERSLVESK